MKTYGVRSTTEDGEEVSEYPLTSRMEEMAPHTRVEPPEEVSLTREAYDRAFAAACRYSGGRDLVEEIMASNYWPLGKNNQLFSWNRSRFPFSGRRPGFRSPALVGPWGRG